MNKPDANRGFDWELVTNETSTPQIKINIYNSVNDTLVNEAIFEGSKNGFSMAWDYGCYWMDEPDNFLLENIR